MATTTIDVQFIYTFKQNLELLLQQEDSRLRPWVTEATYEGDGGKPVDQFGPVVMVDRTTRHAPTPAVDPPHNARWVYPTDSELAILLDTQDKLRLAMDPSSMYMKDLVASINRRIDQHILDAFFATSKVGRIGADTAAFPSGQIIANGGVGLTVSKIKTVIQNFLTANVNLERDGPIIMAITGKQNTDLLNETQVTSRDFNMNRDGMPVMSQDNRGFVGSFLGVKFIHTELIAKDGSSNFLIPAWIRRGMHLGQWQGITTRIDERPDLSYSNQIYVKGTFGATRIQEPMVQQVLCL